MAIVASKYINHNYTSGVSMYGDSVSGLTIQMSSGVSNTICQFGENSEYYHNDLTCMFTFLDFAYPVYMRHADGTYHQYDSQGDFSLDVDGGVGKLHRLNNDYFYYPNEAVVAEVLSDVDLTSAVDSYNDLNPEAPISFDDFQSIPITPAVIDGMIATYNSNNAPENQYSTGSASAPLDSLNGNGCEYIDGTMVTVYGRTTEYSVLRSYMSITDDNKYTAVYDLVAENGAKCTVPEALLTVVPVTVP